MALQLGNQGQWLQQYLPFTVLKLNISNALSNSKSNTLQQYLPFTVLKLSKYENLKRPYKVCCNSTYRLRY